MSWIDFIMVGHIDMNQTANLPASTQLTEFIKQNRIEVLNVSGSMRTEDWKIYRAVRTLIQTAHGLPTCEHRSGFDLSKVFKKI